MKEVIDRHADSMDGEVIRLQGIADILMRDLEEVLGKSRQKNSFMNRLADLQVEIDAPQP